MKILTTTITSFLLLCIQNLFAQNCTINAGVDQVICSSQALTLAATTAGSPNATPNYQWSLVTGSAVGISSPGSLSTAVTGVNPGTYIFQFSGVCQDGTTAYDSITVQVLTIPAQPLAGPDQQICTPQSVTLSANTPPSGQTGIWVIPATTTGITIAAAGNASTTATATTAGVKPLIWKISNAACSLSDTVNINVVSPSTISAGSNFTTGCNGNCVTLNGSDPGLSPQAGLWQMVSGPSTPTFSNSNLKNTSVCNLVAGTYIFKWSVSGPCASGSAQVTVTVSNTYTSPIVGSAVSYTSFCNTSATSSLVLKALSLAPGETGTWSFTSGPTTPTIESPAKASTLVSGLNGTGVYVFTFTVVNAHCSNTVVHTVYFQQPLTGLTTPADQQLACGVTTTTAAITFSGVTNTNGLTRNGTLVSGPITTGVTAVRSGTTPNDTWTMAGMTAVGKYLFRFEYRDACGTTFRDMFVYVSGSPSGATAGSDQLIPCSATSTSLAGNNPAIGTGTWSQVYGPNQASFSSTTAVLPTLTGLIAGTYDFRWTVSAGSTCPPTEDEVIVVKASTTVLAANAGSDVTVCPGSVKLNGNTPGATQTGTWTVSPSAGITFSNVNDPNTFVSGLLANSTHRFTWTIKNACTSSSDAVVVTANSNTPIPLPNAGADACFSSGTTTLSLSGNTATGITSLWRALDGGTISNSASAVTTATIPSDNTYRFEYSLTAPGCTTLYDTVVYTISAATSTAAAGADQNICAATLPQSTILMASTPTVGTGAWSQTGGDGGALIVSPGNATTTINNLSSGQYEFQYLITNGVCSSSQDRVLINITAQPSTANAGPDISQCSVIATTVITLAANTPTSGTGAWTIVSGPFGTAPTFSNATSPTSTITGLSNGIYVLRWTVSTGPACSDSTDDMTLTISRTADASTTVNAYCDVTSISLAGNPGTTGTWTYTSKPAAAAIPSITAISGENALADNISIGAYVFKYTIAAIGSCPSSNSSRTVNIYTAATSLANAGSDLSLCTGTTTATLTGNIPATGTGAWNLVSGPNTPTPANSNAQSYDTSLSNLVEGLYIYRYSINTNSACAASADTLLIIKEKTANALPDQRLCNVSTALLAGNAPVYSTGSWSQISGPNTATILLPSSASTQITGIVAGTYVFSWTIAAVGTCPASSSNVQVIVDAPITATSAGPDLTICPASSSPVLGTTASGGVTYSWSPSTYLSDPTIAQPSFTGTAYPGSYTYTLNSTNGSCTATDQTTITVRAYSANFSISKNTPNTFTAVDAGVGASYLWDFGSGSSPATASTIGPFNVVYNTSGTKTASLTVTDANGCTSTETLSFMAMASSLPLLLLSFTAEAQGDNVMLNWETSDAVDVRSFSIERSLDGTNFSTVGSVTFSPVLNAYSFTDANILAGSGSIYYYRLTITDNDGSFEYSNVRIVKFEGISNQLNASPNPFTDKLTVKIAIEKNESTLSIKLLDNRGAIIMIKKFTGLKQGYQLLQLNGFGYLSSGMYILQVQTEENQVYHIKVVKQ
jgi:K319-like protein/PKD domain-containing protein/type IX secretion system substrate protein